jgi:hypothetical protein
MHAWPNLRVDTNLLSLSETLERGGGARFSGGGAT